ncbi:MAG: M24 family metallopeptidase [Acidobacteriota bacterium]|nr:M24 family metallopeptidase [Acidobacteriota bacterium]
MKNLWISLLVIPLAVCAPRTAAPDPFDPDAAASGLRLGPPVFEAAPAWTGPGLPFPPEDNPWPSVRKERIRTLLGPAMERAGVDAWVLVLRENNNDPLAHHVGGENAGGTAVFLFFLEKATDDGETPGVSSVAVSPAGEATALRDMDLHDSVVAPEPNLSILGTAAEVLQGRNPAKIAVNSSALAAADGLSHTQRIQLEKALGPDLSRRLVSSEDLVVEWLSVKTPREVDIMTRAAEITARLQIEAYARAVPGETTDADLARFLKRRMAQLKVEDAWAPDQNPNVNSGPDRGHSHATDRVIRPGDFIQTDFGIKVWDIWVTDIQRFAYVLEPGGTEPPADALRKWDAAVRGSRAAFAAMRPGVRGLDVDLAQRRVMEEAGSIPVFWGTGHPVGYWAHDVGPALSGGQRGRTPSPAVSRLLRPGQVFAYDGFFSWELSGEETGTKTISVEEMAVVTEDGARFLIAPQDDLILIRSRN